MKPVNFLNQEIWKSAKVTQSSFYPLFSDYFVMFVKAGFERAENDFSRLAYNFGFFSISEQLDLFFGR